MGSRCRCQTARDGRGRNAKSVANATFPISYASLLGVLPAVTKERELRSGLNNGSKLKIEQVSYDTMTAKMDKFPNSVSRSKVVKICTHFMYKCTFNPL